MRIALALFFVLAAAIASAQLPELTVERPVSPPVVAEIPGHEGPRIASNGNGFLAVWTDRRQSGHDFVYAAPLGADGTVRDPFGVRIAEGFVVDVVWMGRGYLVLADTWEGKTVFSLDANGALRERHLFPANLQNTLYRESMASNFGTGTAVRLDLDGRVLESFTIGDVPFRRACGRCRRTDRPARRLPS
jgi:hypothetical protein